MSLFLKLLIWMAVFLAYPPLAILILLVYPIVWLLSIPFRLIGISVEAALEFLRAVLLLPARL